MDESLKEIFCKVYDEDRWEKLLDRITYIQKKLDYKFSDPEKLISSMFMLGTGVDRQNAESYEFLGDSLLNLVVSEFLFYKLPNATADDLTRLKSRLTNNVFLASLTREFDIERLQELFGEMSDTKCADWIESLIGSMYLDSHFEKETIKPIIVSLFKLESYDFDEMLKESHLKDSKSMLNEWVQKTYAGKVSIVYPFTNKGSAHKPIFYVGLILINKNKENIHFESEIGPFDRLKEGELAVSKIFLKKIS